MSKTTTPKNEQSYHFFGSTGLNWACADTREEVLARLARGLGADLIKHNVKAIGGVYAWTTRVELPQASNYNIAEYTPVNVPCSESRQHRITGMHTSSEIVPDTVALDQCVLHDPYGKGTRPAVEVTHRDAEPVIPGVEQGDAGVLVKNPIHIFRCATISRDKDGDWVLFCPNINDAINSGRTHADVLNSIVGVEKADA